MRDRAQPNATIDTRFRNQKYHPAMRTVLATDQTQFTEIARTYAVFCIQRDARPEGDTPFPYEDKYKSYHAPTRRQRLREQRPLTIANRKRVAVMKELDNLVRSARLRLWADR